MEERQNKVLDADYSAVDIPAMVNGLDILSDTKIKLRRTLEKFWELFGVGLGNLQRVEPAKVALMKDRKGAYRIVVIDFLEKLPFHNNSA